MKLNSFYEDERTFGIVVARKNEKFYDMHLVKYNTGQNIDGPTHSHNLFSALANTLREHDLFEELHPFLKSISKCRPMINESEEDIDELIMFGPFSYEALGQIEEDLMKEQGYTEE